MRGARAVDSETKQLNDTMVTVRLELRELSTKMDGMRDVSFRVGEIEDIAKKALDSSKAAHHRLDKIDRLTNWLATTVIGAIILALIGFALKGGFNITN